MRFGLPNIAVKVVQAHSASFRSICQPNPIAALCRLKANALGFLTLARLKSRLDRFEDSPIGAVLGAVAVFGLPILMLALGRLFDGGL